MSRAARIVVFGLAAFCAASLIWVSFELCSISSWIVYNDHIWAEMDRTGHRREHIVAEAFHSVRRELVIVEGVVAVIFLLSLWMCLFSPAGREEDTQTPHG